ncbi:hypothetical protein BCV70DRAFT_117279 [Testicularia cyperi]|uniref:Uncharacterized protein n=1 Tax=Testicularia cyperi TaxID=1882483 RepID=A0A317XMQ8_9BASI|nr:hypothetical protein BCV70DRAFT_117279 [Testicularia cyperi]
MCDSWDPRPTLAFGMYYASTAIYSGISIPDNINTRNCRFCIWKKHLSAYSTGCFGSTRLHAVTRLALVHNPAWPGLHGPSSPPRSEYLQLL